jgi:hypothetical protein
MKTQCVRLLLHGVVLVRSAGDDRCTHPPSCLRRWWPSGSARSGPSTRRAVWCRWGGTAARWSPRRTWEREGGSGGRTSPKQSDRQPRPRAQTHIQGDEWRRSSSERSSSSAPSERSSSSAPSHANANQSLVLHAVGHHGETDWSDDDWKTTDSLSVIAATNDSRSSPTAATTTTINTTTNDRLAATNDYRNQQQSGQAAHPPPPCPPLTSLPQHSPRYQNNPHH